MFKVTIAVASALVLSSSAASALPFVDDHSVNQDQSQGQGQAQGQGQDQRQGQIGINKQQQGQVGINENTNRNNTSSDAGAFSGSDSTSAVDASTSITNPVVSGSSATTGNAGEGNTTSTTTNVDNSEDTDYDDLVIPATLPPLPMNTQPGMAVSCSTMQAQFDYTGGFGGGVGVLNLFSFQGSSTPNNIPKEGLKIAELVATCGMTDQLNAVLDALPSDEALAYKQALAKFIMGKINPDFKYSEVLMNKLDNQDEPTFEFIGLDTRPNQ
ncbi:MAG: hypothetical protein ACRDEA_10690 [Microcystaceae cyanobacterium]